MEDDEKVRYTFMIGILLLLFGTFFSGMVALNNFDGSYDLTKWYGLVTAIVLLLALVLFALDGLVANIVPDGIAKLVAWLGVLLVAVFLLVFWLTDPAFLDIELP